MDPSQGKSQTCRPLSARQIRAAADRPSDQWLQLTTQEPSGLTAVLRTSYCGPSTIRIAPPLVVSRDEAEAAIDVLDECIEIVSKEAR